MKTLNDKSTVKLLDASTINKIAAGEVVERPASCVKELIENSIDAGANRIEVEIINGGKTLMRVTDNGSGMSREDAALAIRRHATSKLSNVRDLQTISTLGFRGEALPTIAAVSKFTLQTRQADDELGTKIKIDGGKNLDTCETGCKVGTTVIVEQIFFNTPARLKFLKSTPTEANKIHDFIVKLALSRPDIAFRFINGGRNALTTPGNGEILDTLAAIYGNELVETLLPLKFSAEELSLSGFIGKPNFLRSYRSWQTFIINGRIVANRTISKAVEESYKSLIPKSGYPFALLKIDVPQNSIDVNVHPQKTEIKFEDEGKIFKAVYNAVREGISDKQSKISNSHDLTKVAAAPDKPRFESLDFDEEITPPEKSKYIIDPNEGKKVLTVEELRDAMRETKRNTMRNDDELEEISIEEETTPKEPPTKKPPKTSAPLEKLFPIGQVDLCYIVAKTDSDLYIVDQHAAHERILFDRLSGYAEQIPAQGLLIHRILKFDSRESLIIENNLDLFAKLGFTLEPSGADEFRLTEIPVDAADSDAENMLREIISSLPEDSSANDDEHRAELAGNIRQAVLAVTACRAAIKAGQELNTRQMQILLDELSQTPHPHTCPHGRPTIIKFSSGDLSKMFKRT